MPMRQPPYRAAASVVLLGAAFIIGSSAVAAEFATVVSSTPVSAAVPVPRQVCSDGQQLVPQRPSGAGAVIGAIAGGVIGHNLGYGAGQAVATGLGAITGAAIGNQVEANATPPAEVPVRRCQTVTNYENRVVGYDVVYEYAGQRYSTRMANDPGTQLAVSVQPVAPDATRVPAPAAYAEPVPAVAPQPYYQPVPPVVYYQPAPPVVYMAPTIGFGYYGGYRGRRWY